MDTILSEADFRGEINVAGTEQPAVAEELQRFIQQYEPSFMEAVLGYDLSTAFYSGAAVDPADQRWTDLANGVVWDDAGHNVNWQGLKACAARYVYFYYMRHLSSLTTTAGEKIPQADNLDSVQVNNKAVFAWNQMSRYLCNLWDYVSQVKDGSGDLLYPEWDNGRDRQFWKFKPINQFGI